MSQKTFNDPTLDGKDTDIVIPCVYNQGLNTFPLTFLRPESWVLLVLERAL